MKKLLIVAMVCALFAPAFAVENVQVTGDIQTIGLNVESEGLPAPMADMRGTTNRVMLGLSADLVEDVQAKLTFAHRSIFGESIAPNTSLTGDNLDNIWDRTHLAEAYVNISNIFDALEVKVGRQFYGNEKSAVMYFGPDYGYAVTNDYASLDGATVRYNGEKFALTAAYLHLNNIAVYPALSRPQDEENLAGLDLDLKLNEQVSANAYVYDVRQKSVTGWGFWGVKPTIEMDNFKLGAEYAMNYGDHEKGWQVKADLALPIGLDDTTITPRVTYLKSEKGFEAYGNYRPGLMFGTVAGIVNNRLGDLVGDWEIINAGLCMKFANLEKWGFGLDFYTGEFDNHFNGNSWEAKIVYNHNQYVAFNLTGAVLTNIRSWKNSPTAVQLGMNIKF